MRLTINLTQENYELLQRVAQLGKVSLNEALNRLLTNLPEARVVTGADGRPLVVGAIALGSFDSRDLEAEDDLRQAELAGFRVR
jgi:hypothetical protein